MTTAPDSAGADARDAQKPFLTSYIKYRETVTTAISTDEIRKQAEEMYIRWMRATAEASVTGNARGWIDAQFEYMRGVSYPEQVRGAIQSAYAAYVADLRKAFTDVDAAALPPSTLATIAQSMLEIAGSAATSVPGEPRE
jgi:hypothetical protein